MPRRLVYLGTPEAAVAPLRALHAAGHDIAMVVSQPDRRRGRGGATMPSPVKAAALELGLPVSDVVDDVLGVGAERGVVVAFGRLIKPHVLAAVPMVNVHFSLLPRWRGAAPVERTILAADAVTGVCIMAVDETLDTGDVYARAEVAVERKTADDLRAELVEIGTGLLVDVLAGDLPAGVPQVGEPTYAAKIDADEWRLDWTTSAVELDRWVRCGHAWTTFRERRLRLLAATPAEGDVAGEPGALVDPTGLIATGVGAVRLEVVQPEGKGPMAWHDFANGARPTVGERFGG